MKGLIISSGYINDYDILGKQLYDNDYIVCADGGVDHLINTGKIPNIVIGDLDSISSSGLDFIRDNNIEVMQFPIMKDKTDTELGILYLLEKKIDDITLMGVTGTRLDHTLASIFLLKKLNKKRVRAKIIDDNNIIYFVNKDIQIKKKDNYNLSIIPISNQGIVVSLSGFLYPLNKKFIEFGSTLGISNEIVNEYGNIFIHKGEALVIESID